MDIGDLLAQCQTAECRSFLEFWSQKCDGDTLPRKSDIDPVDMKRFLSNIFMAELIMEQEQRRYFYRVAGTGIVDSFGFDATMKFADECYSGSRLKRIHRDYDQVLASKMPSVSIAQQPIEGREYLKFEKVSAPLLNADGYPQFIIGFKCNIKVASDD